ncbi:MAG: sigma 54-interacting transcriptional regulator [Pirellulales bacterium]|nr:sigma 54-interacting transcriptional regulator [Pirellulales bacterium]
MARQRTTATELGKILHAANQPVYVLDDECTIVFFNRACQDWLGEAAEDLLGQRCAYHSSPRAAGPEAVAAGLCPPPAAAGRAMTATVSLVAADGRTLHRRARFVPLGAGPTDPIGLVAILDREDLSEPVAAETEKPLADEAEPAELHEQVRRFRCEAAARYRADRLIGHSPAMRRVRRQVELAAAGRANVLVVGPPGSGRQHTATAVHYGGRPQGSGSLIPLACSVLGADLIHSTITALATKGPLGDEAAHSTLLLNEVDQLPAEVQAALAAELVGRPFPLRVVATAQRRLDELAAGDRYRTDLAAALSTLTIELPPLTRRREDIPLLAQLFLEEANARSDRQMGGFTSEAMDLLDAYPWPGQVDQLAQVVAEAHRRAAGSAIGADDLPQRLRVAAEASARPARPQQTIVLDEFLAEVEAELIRRAVAQTKGNKAKAARLLGMTRPRLYRRMVQLGLAKGKDRGSPAD